jgi:hypothetical protein
MKSNRANVVAVCALLGLVIGGLYFPKRASADTTLNICGVVNAYVPATFATPGLLTIDLVPIPILFGANIQGSQFLSVGANVCASLNLNPQGLLSSGIITLNTTTQVIVGLRPG